MPHRAEVQRMIRDEAQTITGVRTYTGANAHSGAETFTNDGGTGITIARLQQTLYDPYTRVWAMSSFNNRLYTKAVLSDWTSFKSVASANLDWVVSGSATAYGGTAGTSGYANLSGSNSSAYAFIKPRTGSPFDRIKWLTNKSPEFTFVIRTANLADKNVCVGLFSTTYPRGNAIGKASSGSNRVEVYVDQNATSRTGTGSGGSWRVNVAGSGGSSASAATGVAADANTVYEINIRISSARIVTVYINGSLVYTSTRAMTTAKALIPMIAVQNEGAKGNFGIVHAIGSQNIVAA